MSAASMSLGELLEDGLFVDGDWVETKDQDPQGDVRLIQLADVGDGYFRNRSSRFLTSARARELGCTFLEPGDILIARMPEPLGRACIFPGVGGPAVTAVDVCIIRPNQDRVKPEWLVKAINSPDFRESMQQFIRGTTRQRISRKNLGTLSLQVPSTDVQLEVARVVDDVLSKKNSVHEYVAVASRTIAQLRQAIFAAASSGRLTTDWRSEHRPPESAEDLIKRSLTMLGRPASTNSSEWSAPNWIDVPESWRWAPMRDLAAIKGGIQKQPKRAPKDNSYPYLRVANVLRSRLELSDIQEFELFDGELELYRLLPGDLLVVEGNGSQTEIGRSALWQGEIPECVHQNHIIRVRCASMDPSFVNLFWNSPIGAREISSLAVTSAGLYSLSTKKIGAVPIPVAPLEEQREIVRRSSELIRMVDDVLARTNVVARSTDRSSQAVLAKAFRGELLPVGGNSAREPQS